MWVSGREDEIVNLDRFDVLRVEGNSLVARQGNEHHVIFHGDAAACRAAFQRCLARMEAENLLVPLRP